MELEELLRAARVAAELRGEGSVEIRDLAYDSRRAGRATLFFCFPGERTDGHDFAAAAVEGGASALVVERPLELDVPQALVEDARAAMAPIAAAFNGDPTSELGVIGITGTNGKTTTAFLIRHLLEAADHHCGLLGTVQQVVGGAVEEVERTTPEAIDLQRTFDRMLESGDEYCAMEVSSHALVLHRADAIHFAVKVFTNLSQDHLDFHADMEDYFEAKRLLFSGEGGAPVIELEGGVSVINIDDAYGRRLAQDLDCGSDGECVSYSAAGGPGRPERPRRHLRRVRLPLRLCHARRGDRGADPASGGLQRLERPGGAERRSRARSRSRRGHSGPRFVEQVPGRFESIDEGQPFAVVVDYAHTPDSLENVLGAARRITSGRLISVFGAGGDRDREKRPLMGRAAAELSDVAVVTSDNPRSEEPSAIIEQIEAGIDDRASAEVAVEQDRRAAIAIALGRAAEGDTVRDRRQGTRAGPGV